MDRCERRLGAARRFPSRGPGFARDVARLSTAAVRGRRHADSYSPVSVMAGRRRGRPTKSGRSTSCIGRRTTCSRRYSTIYESSNPFDFGSQRRRVDRIAVRGRLSRARRRRHCRSAACFRRGRQHSRIEAARTLYHATDLRQRLARYHADPDSAFLGWNDVWLDPAFRAWNIEDRLLKIRCPVLAVQGDDDEYGTMAQIDAIARLVPHARMNLPACGHSPHRDQPAALTDAVVAFLNEHRQVPACSAVAARS